MEILKLERIVAIEPTPAGMKLFTNDGSEHDIDWLPWAIHKSTPYNMKGVSRQVRLQGDNELKYKVFYRNIDSYKECTKLSYIRQEIAYQDTRQSFLAEYPEYRLFQNLKFEDITRFVFDIETTGLNPATSDILCIGWYIDAETHGVITGTEQEQLSELNNMIGLYNPDIIEGWNCYNFDIDFLKTKADKHGLELNWGRDGTPVSEKQIRSFRVGGFERKIKQWYCHGRHLVDGMLEAMRYDVNTGGKMESYGLKDVAVSLGVREDDRVLIDHSDIVDQWASNRDNVIKYCLGDVKETYDIGSIILPPNFYLTSLIPDTYQNVLISGAATKVNQIMVSEYIQENYSIPINKHEAVEYQGGFVELRQHGVFKNVYKADVSSLYPSIMLNFDVLPAQDELRVFKYTLENITKARLKFKSLAKETNDEYMKQYYTGMEKAYKLIINSYYGYMGTGSMTFSDVKAAQTVTSIGRMIVNDMADQLEQAGANVIEIDTDGIYFSSNEDFSTMDFVLPDGINVDIDKPVDYMVSVKAKNYVLVDGDKRIYHGNSLRSRRDEKFGSQFISEVIECLIAGNIDNVYGIYEKYQNDIIYACVDIDSIYKRERITDKIDSPVKRRLKAAVDQTELTIGEYIKVYQKSDGSLTPISQFHNDIDRFYYLERLHKFAGRISELLSCYGIELQRIDKRTFNARYNDTANHCLTF